MKHTKLAAGIAVALSAFYQLPASATNGYFLPGIGFRSQGMGGVGIAYGTDSLSIGANPANIVNTGMRGDIGMGVFNPERSSGVGPAVGGAPAGFSFSGDSESDLKYFLIPEMGMTMPLTERLHVGMAFVANGGMNTSYPVNFFSYKFASPNIPPTDAKVGVDLQQLIIPLTLGYRVNDNNSLGVSLNLATQRFKAYGLEAFKFFQAFGPLSIDNNHLTGNGYDYGYGAGVRVGWLGEYFDKRLSLGATYASKTYMTKFEKYRGLFAEQGGFDIPENYGIGVSYRPVKNLTLAADVSRIMYADVASVGNPGPNGIFGPQGVQAFANAVSSTSSPNALGADDGMGFGWGNQTVYKIGVNYGVNQRLQVRAGYNYAKTPIPNNQVTFNTLAPATVERHYSVGFTYKASDELEVTGMYMYVAPHSQTACGQNIVGCATFNMHQNVFGVSLGWVLDPGMDGYGDAPMKAINFDGWYAGFGAGQNRSNDFKSSDVNDALITAGATSTTSVDNSDLGVKGFAGYQFNKYLALEGGFAYFNNYKATSTITAPTAGSVYTSLQNDAWTLSAVGTLPITKSFSVFGKVGANMWRTTARSHVRTATTSVGVGAADSGTDALYGVGASYALLDNVDVRAEYERYDFGGLNIDFLSGGMAVKF